MKKTSYHVSARLLIPHSTAVLRRSTGRRFIRSVQSALLLATATLFTLPAAKAGTGTLSGLTADAEVHSSGTVANVSAGSALVGGSAGVQIGLVNMFQLPAEMLADPTLQFSDATYSVKTGYMGSWSFNGDLYGIGYSTTSPSVVASDYYEGTLDTASCLIQDNFITGTIPSYTTVSASNSALVSYLNAQLKAAREDEASTAYVFFRINPDAYIYWNFYQIGTADNSSTSYTPKLAYTTINVPLWQSVAIGGGGFVTGLTSSPSGDAIYARTDVGGAYRWDATHTKWLPITDSLPNDSANNGPTFGIGSIAVDPNDSKRVFISSGKFYYSNPSGIYMTSDATATSPTWSCIDSTVRVYGNGGRRQVGERLAVDPYNSNVVYYGAENITSGGSGLKKYYYDTAWHSGTLGLPAVGSSNCGISFVALDHNGGSVSDGTRTVCKYMYVGVYNGTAGSGGVYTSSDGGSTWTKITNVVVDKPNRGEIASDGTLYVSFDGTFASNGGVVKVARGETAFTSVAPVASLNYCGLAVDPTAAGTVMVAEYSGSNRLWRTIDSGTSWVLMNRTVYTTEPDGTDSVTAKSSFMSVADLMINPANPNEVWGSDMLGVQYTGAIQNTTTAADWYQLQKNHEEICCLDLKCAPTGSRLLSGVADDNGYVHNEPTVRPVKSDQFDNPGYISTTSVDYSAGTSGSSTVWARVGDIYYYTYTDSDRAGGVSLNDGRSWIAFGQLDAKTVKNSGTADWETFDVGPYLKQQKDAGAQQVTLCVRANVWTNQYYLRFSSREGTNPPQLVIDGTTTLTPTADAFVYKSGSNTNYGQRTELQVQNYYEQANYNRRAYLKFDLTGVSSISTATLKLYRVATSDTTAFSTLIYASPTTDWVEGDGGSDNTPTGEITWSNMPTDYVAPPDGSSVHGGHVALSSSDPAKIAWVAENGYVYYSKNRGVSWSRATLSGSAMSANTTTEFQMARSPLSADRVLADTFYLYSTTGSGTVYRSTDGGATWAAMTSAIGSVTATTYTAAYKLESVPGMSGKLWFCAQTTNVGAYFKYWNGTNMVTVPNITTVVDFAFGKAADGRTNPTVFVRKANGTYWYSVDATEGVTFTWTQMAVPTINNQPCVMAGDLQQFGRLYVGTNGRGIFFTDVK